MLISKIQSVFQSNVACLHTHIRLSQLEQTRYLDSRKASFSLENATVKGIFHSPCRNPLYLWFEEKIGRLDGVYRPMNQAMPIFSNSELCRPPSISFTSFDALLVYQACANEKLHQLFTAVTCSTRREDNNASFQFSVTCRFGYCLETTSRQHCLEKCINSDKEVKTTAVLFCSSYCQQEYSFYAAHRTGKISKKTWFHFKFPFRSVAAQSFISPQSSQLLT